MSVSPNSSQQSTATRNGETKKIRTERPLSPHLSAYRWQLTSLLSIAHRLSGVALVLGLIFLSLWLFLVGADIQPRVFTSAIVQGFGKLILLGFTLAFFYHLLNGIRHLFWDFEVGLELPQVYRSGYAVVILTVLLTIAVWFIA